MSQPLSWFAILFILGAGQGAFLSLSLLTSNVGSHKANRYLAALTLLFTIALFDYFLELIGLSKHNITLSILLWPKEFFYGVFIYFYVRELTHPGQVTLSGKQWLHFLPGFIHIIITWSLLFTSTEFQHRIFADEPVGNTTEILLWLFFALIETILSMIQILIYLALSFRLLHQHRLRIKQTFSTLDKINLHWLTRLLVGLLCVYLIWIVGTFLPSTITEGDFFDMLIGCSMVALIYVMGYLGLRQPQIFTAQEQLHAEQLERMANDSVQTEVKSKDISPSKKYQNSTLDNELSLIIVNEIKSYMVREKPYLNNQISLPQLSDQIGISVHHLSQTINEQLKQNFFDFINSYRIEEAKRRLASPQYQKHSILTIAMDAGFNSKSSFYNAFKKHMAMTPTQYRKSLNHKE